MKKNRFLYICGCPRSGTSVLALVLGHHPGIIMGVERYHNITYNQFTITQEHFNKERFFDVQEGDSHINMFEHESFSKLGANYKERFDQHYYIGDKVPLLYYRYEPFFEEFERNAEVKIVYILRNIFDVASSYQYRLNDTTDRWKRTMDMCIRDWNDSMAITENYIKKGKDIIVVQYEDLFYGDQEKTLSLLMKKLKISVSKELLKEFNGQNQHRKDIEGRRLNYTKLDPHFKRSILQQADIELYRRFISDYSI